ncbi:MAG TPA: T9SS type A sorting domain-containing protein [Bacteroidia bacterium]|nr:T9SS type A sorting domain-containing protein [Bacteroidia bacterium]
MNETKAQFDVQCNGRDKNSLFFAGLYIYRMDSMDTNPTAPIILDTNLLGFTGLSINNRLDSAGAPETMYFCWGDSLYTYHYWNGNNLVNTFHLSGGPNPSGTSQYIFNLAPFTGAIYRYDGTSNSVAIVTGLPTFNSIYELATDSAGNFYILYTIAQKLVVYDPNAIPIDSFPITGISSAGGNGMALLGGRIYVYTPSGLKEGILNGSTYDFNTIWVSPPNLGCLDMASCPSAATPLPVISKKLANEIFVSPNPAQDYVKIKAEKLVGKSCRITVTDVTGKKLKEEHVIFATGIVTLDVGELKSGIYFLRIETKEGSFVERLVKK